MYKKRGGQIDALSSPMFFGGVRLDTRNVWVQMAELIPWEAFERKYAENFEGSTTGNPAKPARMAIGTLVIKERYRFSDDDVIEEIRMNPYLQYFIGQPEFTHEAPFDQSVITRFRQRVTPEMLSEINDIVIGRKKVEEDEKEKKPPDDEPPTGGGGMPEHGLEKDSEHEPVSEDESANEGTMILDATCAPQDIRYPTDISLLSEAREKLEEMIDVAHGAGLTEGKKPRTYPNRARRDYLRFARNRKPNHKLLRKSLRKQLGYVGRDLSHLDAILSRHPDALSERLMTYLLTIRTLFEQQIEMYDKRTHSVEHRIVSLHQPYVRPIVRGKSTAPVEFGAKVGISLINGFARVEKLSWDAFNEGGTLQETVERFKADTGHYPARILADKLYRTRENLAYCKKHGIRMSGPKLGRPPNDKALYREQCRIEREESGERSAIEGTFGVGKRRYTLERIMTRLQHTSEVSIHVSFLTMNLFRRLRLLLVLFSTGPFLRPKPQFSSSDPFLRSRLLPLCLALDHLVACAVDPNLEEVVSRTYDEPSSIVKEHKIHSYLYPAVILALQSLPQPFF